ncbi:MAG: dUTP diphosphatase [Cyanobacteria bacterium K_DeepCast_35m_m2_023]|nr:dUTP diphosphatase [Cyanobacteria bacterium K_DeepCast_35m_m2_023]
MWQADGSISVYAIDENDKLVSEWTGALQYQTKYSAGLDLCTPTYIDLPPLCRTIVDTGVYLKDVMPASMAISIRDRIVVPASLQVSHLPFAMVCSRSGLAAKEGIIVLNAPGIIDADYEETIKVVLYNTNPTISIHIPTGARIAQLVFAYAYRRTELVKEEQRTGGLGSTGTGEPPYK